MADTPLQLDLSPLEHSPVDLSQFMGLWSIDETHALQLLQHIQQLNWTTHLVLNSETRIDKLESRIVAADEVAGSSSGGAIAVISIDGAMTKRGSSLSQGGSTIRARREIRNAVGNPEVVGILLKFDSPGGTVSGTHDLAMDVRQANESKPVCGFIEDLGASAAYRVLVECDQIFANEPSALVGSIGTLMGLYDLSGLASQKGIKPVVIKSGQLKGTGFEGMPVTEEQQAYLQSLVDQHQTEFNAAVARGRKQKVDHVATNWATGRVWPANDALAMGLIDGIQSFDQTLSQLADQSRKRSAGRKAISHPKTERTNSMPETTTFLTMAAVIAACAGFDRNSGDDTRFAVDQLERNADLDTIQKNWAETLKARLDAREQEVKDLQIKTKSNAASAPGVDPLITGSSNGTQAEGSATEEFWAAVDQKQARGMSRQDAISKTVVEDKDRHQRFLQEHNKQHRRK